MTGTRRESFRSVGRERLRVGDLLAEGGEGRVYALPLEPHLVFKEYRRPVPRGHLDDLVTWPGHRNEGVAARVRTAAAWPECVVEPPASSGWDPAEFACGVLMPRAPRRFALRHRDGTTRLATLSYLTADPVYRTVAYGIDLPPPSSPERLGLVLALARVLEAFEADEPAIAHGDLSAKNVLWSLSRGPEVFLLDCDNCERFTAAGAALSDEGRRRAMTPNWDDPSVTPGSNPGPVSDRYSLALVFLRVFGAANFPVQARQRQGGPINIDFPLPPDRRSDTRFGPSSPLWDLCARGLSVEMALERPGPADWVAALEAIHPPGRARPAAAKAPDVTIRPVAAAARPSPPERVLLPAAGQARARVVPSAGPPRPPADPKGESVLAQMASGLGVGAGMWVDAHRAALSSVRSRAPAGQTAARAALCAGLDVAILVLVVFFGAMVIAPVLGI